MRQHKIKSRRVSDSINKKCLQDFIYALIIMILELRWMINVNCTFFRKWDGFFYFSWFWLVLDILQVKIKTLLKSGRPIPWVSIPLVPIPWVPIPWVLIPWVPIPWVPTPWVPINMIFVNILNSDHLVWVDFFYCMAWKTLPTLGFHLVFL